MFYDYGWDSFSFIQFLVSNHQRENHISLPLYPMLLNLHLADFVVMSIGKDVPKSNVLLVYTSITNFLSPASSLPLFSCFVSFQIPPTVATIDALERYTQISSHPLHKTSKPGIVSLDIHYDKVQHSPDPILFLHILSTFVICLVH